MKRRGFLRMLAPVAAAFWFAPDPFDYTQVRCACVVGWPEEETAICPVRWYPDLTEANDG